ncbi:MAG: hypothetical protein LPK45_11875 [Bacteroidota bacterium]|nr:hypothetical protein [Bacteroidota bacterium]MDX5431810.1 hypothetical protein [Bacteroidota bacterium]MDX5470521.1 hypothetical protein [Bacteroidota bacterium]
MTNPNMPLNGKVYCLDTATLSMPSGKNNVFLAIHADSLKIAHIEMHAQSEQGSYKQFILNLAKKENLHAGEETHFIMDIPEEQAEVIANAFPFLRSVVANKEFCKNCCKPAWEYLEEALKKG